MNAKEIKLLIRMEDPIVCADNPKLLKDVPLPLSDTCLFLLIEVALPTAQAYLHLTIVP